MSLLEWLYGSRCVECGRRFRHQFGFRCSVACEDRANERFAALQRQFIARQESQDRVKLKIDQADPETMRLLLHEVAKYQGTCEPWVVVFDRVLSGGGLRP